MEESLILLKFDALVKSGLVEYDKKQEIIEHLDEGLKFRFLLSTALAKKPTIKMTEPEVEQSDHGEKKRGRSDISTEGYEIGDLGGTHFLVANKFCFARPHLLLLTSDEHRKQYEPLREEDVEAAWNLLKSVVENYAAFYNCGQDGGCSRLHKHMQLMPLPQDSFATFLDSQSDKEPAVPFHWFYRIFEYQQITSANLTKIYLDLLDEATIVGQGCSEHAESAPAGAACPHNMILTKRWMIVIPRRRGAVTKTAGVNALGMLGLIAVATKDEIDAWIQQGLANGLREVGVPK